MECVAESKKRGIDAQKRLEMLYIKALACRVYDEPVSGQYEVISTSGAIYNVFLDEFVRQCDCENGLRRIVATCSHVLAAAIERMKSRGYIVIGVACNEYKYDKTLVDCTARLNAYTRLLLRRQ